MIPAEQGQERWSECPDAEICRTCPCAGDDDVCFPGERLRAELEMCQRYFPFMRRSRDEAVRKLSACQEERDAAGVEADEQRRERQAAETARDEAVRREKALREALQEIADTNGWEFANVLADKARAALDQSGKGARR